MTRFLSGVRDIAAQYDYYIVDLWGVMHNGIRCYDAALECLAELRKAEKIISLLSNAPRRIDDVVHRSQSLGLPPTAYDFVYSSGEMTWIYLQEAPLGKRAFPIMTEKDISLIEKTPVSLVEKISDADFILCSGPDEHRPVIADWDPLLKEAAIRQLPMLCANPDLIVHRGDDEEICAGALAQHYEHLGGKVVYMGKPHKGIYAELYKKMGIKDPQTCLTFGDSLRTDVQGAKDAGADSLFVAGGIHHRQLLPDLTPARFNIIAKNYTKAPDYILPYLCW